MPIITIIGNTSWGNALGALLSEKNTAVRLWTRSEAEAEELNQGKHRYSSTSDIRKALDGADLVIWAVPSQKLRENAQQASPYLTGSMLFMSAVKGLEVDSGKRMSQVLAEEVASPLRGRVCVLSGPNLAREINQGLPAASMIAAEDEAATEIARQLMESPRFLLSTSRDVVGVELGGSLKNIIALGAGMIDGLALGDNAKGAFMAWGWTEAVYLGVALGASAGTFCGLAGLGDLIATCAGNLSRNHYVGYELAKGRSLADISASMSNVAEGVATTRAARRLAEKHGLHLPIIELIHGILFEGLSPSRALVDFRAPAASHC
ncbi:MAG: NAD(P)H-dependent glycerol-3-phosphate dehydrogenase [Dehalococcoidia bacterium]